MGVCVATQQGNSGSVRQSPGPVWNSPHSSACRCPAGQPAGDTLRPPPLWLCCRRGGTGKQADDPTFRRSRLAACTSGGYAPFTLRHAGRVPVSSPRSCLFLLTQEHAGLSNCMPDGDRVPHPARWRPLGASGVMGDPSPPCRAWCAVSVREPHWFQGTPRRGCGSNDC